MQLRSGVAVPVVQASSYISDLTPSLVTYICLQCGPKKTKTTIVWNTILPIFQGQGSSKRGCFATLEDCTCRSRALALAETCMQCPCPTQLIMQLSLASDLIFRQEGSVFSPTTCYEKKTSTSNFHSWFCLVPQ